MMKAALGESFLSTQLLVVELLRQRFSEEPLLLLFFVYLLLAEIGDAETSSRDPICGVP